MDPKREGVEGSEKIYPFAIDHVPEEFLRKAEVELNETPENSTRLLQELKSMTKNEKSFDGVDFHEDFLRLMLRHGKYNIEKTFKRLLSYYNFRKNHGTIFGSVDPEKIENVPDYKFCTVLPWRCKDGCTMLYIDMSKWDPNNIPMEDVMRLSIALYYQNLRNPVAQINGFKIIIEWKDATLRQVKYMTPVTLYRCYQGFLNLIPARIKGVHMVNQTSTMKIFWTLFKPFLSAKLKSRYVFHSKPEDLLNYFPKKALPVQYGGELEDYFNEDWMKYANEQQRLATLAGQANIF